MNDDRFPFTADQVEEQVAWLRRQSAARMGQPISGEQQLVEDLARLYQHEREDEQSLDDVRARLESQVGVRGRGQRSAAPAPPRRPGAGQGGPPRRAGWARLTALAAAVLLVVVVGGLVVGLVLVGHGNTGGHPTATVGATPSLPPVPPTAYGILNENAVVALDPVTGATLWQQKYPEITSMNLYAVQDQTIYVGKYSQSKQTDTLNALSARDGTQRWEITPFNALGMAITKTLIIVPQGSTIQTWDAQTGAKGWTFQGPPIGTQIEALYADEAADTVYAAGTDNQSSTVIYAINLTTGKERWHVRDVQMVAAIGQTVYVTSLSGQIFTALNASDGTERWHIQADLTDGGWSEPTILNGIIYITELSPIGGGQKSQGVMYALQESDGNELWHTQPAQDGIVSQIILSQGVAYASDAKGIYAFNSETGQQSWHTRYASFIDSDTPVVQDGLVFMGWTGISTTPGNLTYIVTVLDAATGVERWRYLVHDYTPPVSDAAPEPAPLVGDGVAFVISNYDALSQGIQALRASDGTPLWQKDSLTSLIVS